MTKDTRTDAQQLRDKLGTVDPPEPPPRHYPDAPKADEPPPAPTEE